MNLSKVLVNRFRPTVINKTGDLSTEIAKFLFFRRRSKDLSLISLPINLENMGKIIALANQKRRCRKDNDYD
jgi:chromosome segregation ATPase